VSVIGKGKRKWACVSQQILKDPNRKPEEEDFTLAYKLQLTTF